MSTIATANLGKRQRYGQLNKLLYMTDGFHIPKMYDGDSLVNWGITAPTTAIVQASSSSGANQLDTCELAWTPASLTLLDGESAFLLATGITNALVSTSSDCKVGSTSSLLLLGYISEPLTSNTALMLHWDGLDGAATTVDSSILAHTPAMLAGTVLDDAQKKFGTTACLQPVGVNYTQTGYTSIPTNACFNTDIHTTDLTIEGQFRARAFGAVGNFLFSRGSFAPTHGISMYYTPGTQILEVRMGSAIDPVLMQRVILLNTATWYHVRFCVQGGIAFLFVDGILLGLPVVIPATSYMGPVSAPLLVGGNPAGTAQSWDGWIDEFRWENGTAFSTADFIPPTSAYGSLVAPTSTPLGVVGLVAYKNVTPTDYSGYYGVKVWLKSVAQLAEGDVALTFCSAGSGVTVLETLSVPSLVPNEWTQVTHKFTNPAIMTAVTSIGLVINRDLGQNAFYLDDMQVIRCNVTREDRPAYIAQGGASVRLEVPGNVPDGVLLAYKALPATDMHSDTIVSFSLRSDKELATQQLKYLLDDTAACASPLESIYIPDLLAADVFNNVQLTLVTPAALVAVISHGLYLAKRNLAPCNLWIDDVKRAVSTAGNLNGRYFSWCSFYSSKYDRESDLSPISGVVDCVGQAISLSSIPLSSDTQVDMRRIYRSAAGGTVPYLDSTIADNTTTTLVLNKSDASILSAIRHPSLLAGSGKFAPPPAAPYVVQHKNRFILAGSFPYDRGTVTANNASATFTFTSAQLDDSFIGRVIQIIGDTTSYIIQSVNAGAKTCVARPLYDLVAGTYRGSSGAGKVYYIYSDSENTVFTSYIDDDDTARPHGFPIEYAQDIIEGKAGDRISGLGLVGDAILVTKLYSTHILEGAFPPFANSKISSVVGCASHDTIIQDELANAMWLAGDRGLAYSDGGSVNIVSNKIEDIFRGTHELGLNPVQYANSHAVYDVSTKLYYLFCASKTSSTNDICLVMYKNGSDPMQWEWYYFTGIDAASSTIVYDAAGTSKIYIADYDGFQYQLNVGWNDGVQSGTLSGTPTGGTPITLVDTGAAFYTTGSGLRNMSLLLYDPLLGTFETKKILSNTATEITIASTAAWIERAPKAGGTETYISSMIVFNGKLYGSSAQGGSLWEWSGTAWVIKAPKLGLNTGIMSMVIYNNELYGGTSPWGNLYKWNGVNAWTNVATQLAGETGIYGLAVFNNKIYGSTVPNGKLLEWNGVNAWIEKAPSPGGGTNSMCLKVFNNKLYTFGDPNGKLYEWNGVDAWVVKSGNLGTATGWTLEVFNNKLYGGTGGGAGALLYEWNGVDLWVLKASSLAGASQTRALVVYRDSLYGTSNGGGKLMRWNGINAWVEAAAQLGTEFGVISSVVFNNKLYGGTNLNAKLYEYDVSSGFVVNPSSSYRYYLGGYELDWKSKKFELLRPTDKKLLIDAVLNNYKLAVSQKVQIQILKNLGATQIANQLRDLAEGEEHVFLIRERVSQAQWRICGFVHGQNIQIVSLGLRLKARGIR